jgi:hypothetical protein
MQPTWTPHEKHGQLTAKSDLPDTVFAFPKQRKEPLTDAKHVRNAVARFDQVIDVSDDDRALAFANIEKAAKYYDVDLSETSWRELGVHPQRNRKQAAAKAVATKASAENYKEAGARGAAAREVRCLGQRAPRMKAVGIRQSPRPQLGVIKISTFFLTSG